MSFPLVDSGVLADAEALVMDGLKAKRADASADPVIDPAKAHDFFVHFVHKLFGVGDTGSGSSSPQRSESSASQTPGNGSAAVAASSTVATTTPVSPGEAEEGGKRKRRKQNTPSAAAAAAQGTPVVIEESNINYSLLKPMSTTVSLELRTVEVQTFYGNKRFYVFMRVFALLCERLRRAKELELDKGQTVWKPAFIIEEPSTSSATATSAGGEASRYSTLLGLVRKQLGGGLDNSRFEDDVRALFGINAYLLFTIDRLLDFLCHRLTAILTGDESVKLLGLWEYEQKRTGGSGLQEPT
jgi:paired amphipathic helix protein Sin3a